MWVWSLGGEDLLEKEMATHCSFFAWKIPWTEELGRAVVHRVTKTQIQLKRLSTEPWVFMDLVLTILLASFGSPLYGNMSSLRRFCFFLFNFDVFYLFLFLFEVFFFNIYLFCCARKMALEIFASCDTRDLWSSLQHAGFLVVAFGVQWLDSLFPAQGTQVWSLVRELDTTCCNQRFCMLLFISLSVIIALARPSSTILNRNGVNGHSSLIPDLSRKVLCFSTAQYDNSMLVIYHLYYV